MKIHDLFQRSPRLKSVPTQVKSKQLKATAKRVAVPIEESYDYDEPNVRLSRAFLVVMLLHVVAVGGIFAFSSLKKDASASAPASESKNPDPAANSDFQTDSRVYVVGAGENLGGIASAFGLTRNDLESVNKLAANAIVHEGDKIIIPVKSSSAPLPIDVQKLLRLSDKSESTSVSKAGTAVSSKPADDAQTGVRFYIVQKGDNPVGIAKRLKVKYVDLLTANKITDPHKLQIGQKLIIPE